MPCFCAPSQGERAACAGDGLNHWRRRREAQPEDRAVIARAAAIGGAVENAIGSFQQRGISGICAVGAIEGNQGRQRTGWRQPE